MLRVASLALILLTPGACVGQRIVLDPPPAAVIAADAGDLYDPGTIVALADDAAAADRLVAAAPGYPVLSRETLGGIGQEMIIFGLQPSATAVAAIAELEALEPGVTAGVNHAYRPSPVSNLPRGREYANALLGWPQAGCPALVSVGIIDTDLAIDAPGLAGATVARKHFVPEGGDSDHGTAIAELIAGPGRLTGARLYHAAVVGDVDGKAPAAGVDGIVRAMDWLMSNDVTLVNISLAGPYNKILDRGLQAAERRGMVIVAAAGNTGKGGPPRYPAGFRQTIAVTAVDAMLRPYANAPDGGHIDIAAPGVDVFIPQGRGHYLSGTSIAAPFVTSILAADPVAARLRSAREVRDWLGAGARDLGASGPDPTFGAGLVQTGTACRAR